MRRWLPDEPIEGERLASTIVLLGGQMTHGPTKCLAGRA